MTVLSRAVTGFAVVPERGSVPCGFFRPLRHRCSSIDCRLNGAIVMAFDPELKAAIASCRHLWKVEDEVQLIYSKLRIEGLTLQISRDDFGEDLNDGSAEAWTDLRSLADEHDPVAIRLGSVSALVSFPGTPGRVWQVQTPPRRLPRLVEPSRPVYEHLSWQGRGLPGAEDLLAEDDEAEGGEL